MPVFMPFQRKIGCFTAENAKKKNGYSIKITVLMCDWAHTLIE